MNPEPPATPGTTEVASEGSSPPPPILLWSMSISVLSVLVWAALLWIRRGRGQ